MHGRWRVMFRLDRIADRGSHWLRDLDDLHVATAEHGSSKLHHMTYLQGQIASWLSWIHKNPIRFTEVKEGTTVIGARDCKGMPLASQKNQGFGVSWKVPAYPTYPHKKHAGSKVTSDSPGCGRLPTASTVNLHVRAPTGQPQRPQRPHGRSKGSPGLRMAELVSCWFPLLGDRMDQRAEHGAHCHNNDQQCTPKVELYSWPRGYNFWWFQINTEGSEGDFRMFQAHAWPICGRHPATPAGHESQVPPCHASSWWCCGGAGSTCMSRIQWTQEPSDFNFGVYDVTMSFYLSGLLFK